MDPFKDEAATIVAKFLDVPKTQIESLLEVPKNSERGDYSLPCFKFAKTLKKSPPEIALELVSHLEGNNQFEKVQAAGPYLNFSANQDALAEYILLKIFKEKDSFGIQKEKVDKTVVIDFSSPNIAKPIGIGHLRSTVLGNSVSRLFSALNYNVVRLNHLGDWGKQFGLLSVAFNLWGDESLLKTAPIDHLYEIYVRANGEIERGNTGLNDQAKKYFQKMEQGDKKSLLLWERFRSLSLIELDKIYKRLNIAFDSFNGEAFFNDKMSKVIKLLKTNEIAKLSQGAWIIDLEKEGLGVAMIEKGDGTTTYLTRDLAAAIYRWENYQFDELLYVVGQPQELHFKQLFRVLELMGFEWANRCFHVMFGYILGMSTRKGNLVFLEEVLDEAQKRALIKMKESPVGDPIENEESVAEIIGQTAVIFNDLSNARIKDIEFNWDRMLSFEGDTGPYLQNAHARISGIIRKSGTNLTDKIQVRLLTEPSCHRILKSLIQFSAKIKSAAHQKEPSLLSKYLIQVAQALHSGYNDLKVKGEKKDLAEARLLLFWAGKQVLSQGMNLLGIKPLEKM